tara:strand:+ start:798 stop:1169 length:372 start_codon:yes stop_codon:yes gene_type:complete
MKKYLAEWEEAESPKPVNNVKFIADFIEFMKSRDSDHYEFEGDNDYCGCTAIIWDENPRYCMGRSMYFEFAYSNDFVKVFTGNHNGFWVPEYISLKGDDAQPILKILQDKFNQWGGFSVAPQR